MRKNSTNPELERYRQIFNAAINEAYQTKNSFNRFDSDGNLVSISSGWYGMGEEFDVEAFVDESLATIDKEIKRQPQSQSQPHQVEATKG